MELDSKEERCSRAYTQGFMKEQIYKDQIHELNVTRGNLVDEIRATEDELANKPSLPLEKLVDGVVKLVAELDFTKRRQIIQKLVTKVVATKEDVTVWGYIPILTTEKVGLNDQYRDCGAAECW